MFAQFYVRVGCFLAWPHHLSRVRVWAHTTSLTPFTFLLKCLYQAMTMTGHVFVCYEYRFYLFLCFSFYWILNCSDSVVFFIFHVIFSGKIKVNYSICINWLFSNMNMYLNISFHLIQKLHKAPTKGNFTEIKSWKLTIEWDSCVF